jgi:hypothetical protein
MDGVELLYRHPKPSAMESMDPIMSKSEDQKPPEQHHIVYNRTPQEDITRYLKVHRESSLKQLTRVITPE